MKKLLEKTLLDDLFNVHDTDAPSENDIRYHGSLIPKVNSLKKINTINFQIRLGRYKTDNSLEFEYENSVNHHIFKPRFFQYKKGEALCLVPSKEVLAHTLRSLFIMNRYFNKKHKIEINAIDMEEEYYQFCKNWKIQEAIFIGRVESILNFLRMQQLKKRKF